MKTTTDSFRYRRAYLGGYEVLYCGPHGKRLGYVYRFINKSWCWRLAGGHWSQPEYKTRNEAAEALRKAVKRGD